MTKLEKLYLANPVISLYEGDDDGGTATVDPPPKPPGAPSGLGLNSDDPNIPVDVDPDARFDQDAVNKIVQDRLAKDRKKHEEKYKGLEKTYKDLLANQALTQEERERLEAQLDDLQKQHRTKEEQAKHEKRQLQEKYENELQEYKEAAVKWETQHKEYMIQKSLTDAAIAHDAFMPGQIYDIVRKWTKLVDAVDESGKPTGQLTPVVDLPDVDADTGKPIITQRTPMEAVERLKEKLQPNLFKSNVVSGVGGNSSTGGGGPGADGRIDPSDLTTEQWMKIYKDDPTKLGLRGKRR
jgi:hypothetical protein